MSEISCDVQLVLITFLPADYRMLKMWYDAATVQNPSLIFSKRFSALLQVFNPENYIIS